MNRPNSDTFIPDCMAANRDLPVETVMAMIRHNPPGPWPRKVVRRGDKEVDVPKHCWHCWENTQEAMRRLADEYLATMPDYPGHYKGRGIVTAGGGIKYFPSIWVCVSKLRHLGCKLPIQVWYLGPDEMDPRMISLLERLDVECIDALEVARHIPCRILCGWELKVYAALHSPFKEVIFLDADNHALRDPVYLFDTPQYHDKGAIFWPDYDYWTLDEELFRIFGIPYAREKAFESGQLVFDKQRAWAGIQMAMWYCEHSDYVFKHVYGDKEAFHLGWRKAGLDYAMPQTGPAWQADCCIVQNDPAGKPLFLHRVGDKWKLNGDNKRTHLPDEALHHEMVASLRSIWNGRMWSNPTPSPSERELIKALCYHSFRYRRLPHGRFAGDERILELLPGSRIGQGAEQCERRWEINQVRRGQNRIMILSICGTEAATCHLELDDGVWKGRWSAHERCHVEMTPVDSDIRLSRSRDCDRMQAEIAAIIRKHGYSPDHGRIGSMLADLDG